MGRLFSPRKKPAQVHSAPAVEEPAVEQEEPDQELEARLDIVVGELGRNLEPRVLAILTTSNVGDTTARARAINEVCAEHRVSVEDLNRRLATGRAAYAEYARWMKEKGINPNRRDREQAAADVSHAVERRRVGLTLRLKDRQLGVESRLRYEAELEELEREEDRSFAQLHPCVVAGEQGARGEAYCRCGRGMTRHDRYRFGPHCSVCRSEYEARLNQPWRAVL